MSRPWPWMLALLLSFACGKPREQAQPAPPKPEPPRELPGPEPEADPPGSAAPDRAEVQAAVDAWLAAQSGGDFAAYQALYADKLEGVKRVGGRTWRFDRKGWMADRERMFKRPMTVTARDLEVSGSARTPVVTLVQSFQQGKFADQGPKRLVFTRVGGALRIAREEMLHSTVAGAAAADTGNALLTLTLGATSYAVLPDQPEPSWASGKLEGPFTGGDGAHFALRAAEKAPMAASWKSRTLAVYSASGRRCEAAIGRLVLLAGGTPHFGEVQAWDGQDGAPVLSRSQRARAIYELAPPVLAAELTLDPGCAPVLATDAGAKPIMYTATAAPSEAAAAVSAFRQLPGYRALQAEFTGTYGGKGEWAATPQTTVLESGSQRVVVVWAKQGAGCGDFYGALTAVYAVGAGLRLRLLTSDEQGFFEPRLVLDLDGDGLPEIVGTPDDFSTLSAIYRWSAAGYSATRSLAFPFNDCGC